MIMEPKSADQVPNFKVDINQVEQFLTQIKIGSNQNQVNLESLRTLLSTVWAKTADLEKALQQAQEKFRNLSQRASLSQTEQQKAELRIKELESLAESYKRNLDDQILQNTKAMELSKAEAKKNLMIKETFENYVDYAVKSTADKLKEHERENKELKALIASKEEQFQSNTKQLGELKQAAQTYTKNTQELQGQVKRLTGEKNMLQRSFEQRIQAAEQMLNKEKSFKKLAQERMNQLELTLVAQEKDRRDLQKTIDRLSDDLSQKAHLELSLSVQNQEIVELRQLNASLRSTLRLDIQPPPFTASESSDDTNATQAPLSPPPPSPSRHSEPEEIKSSHEPPKETPSHRIEESSDGMILLWN
jgi:DNA repair exonuclease SbcCD ATPase subunit